MKRIELQQFLNDLLQPELVKDYAPNGLQIEGSDEIGHLVTGVTASLALIDAAIELEADAILVHHGYFWKSEDYRIIGMKKRRIEKLLSSNINLFAYHLPIDIHPVLGNNFQLGKTINAKNIQAAESINPRGIVMHGELEQSYTHSEFKAHLESCFCRNVIAVENDKQVQSVAWCTGGGQGYIDQVADSLSVDAFISGEISEQTTHSAREQNIDYFAVGHHASERYGVKAVGEYLAQKTDLRVTFIDIDNPA